MDEEEIAKRLDALLNEHRIKIAVTKRAHLLDGLAELIPAVDGITSVSVAGARSVVETVELHGLRIGVDALGRAAEVEFPEGATWTA
jgi:hypothetical protein